MKPPPVCRAQAARNERDGAAPRNNPTVWSLLSSLSLVPCVSDVPVRKVHSWRDNFSPQAARNEGEGAAPLLDPLPPILRQRAHLLRRRAALHARTHLRPQPAPWYQPPWRQPRGKEMVSLANSHTNATSKRWHLWEIDSRVALNSTPGRCIITLYSATTMYTARDEGVPSNVEPAFECLVQKEEVAGRVGVPPAPLSKNPPPPPGPS